MKIVSRGFTLLELMIVVALAGVLITLALPEFSAMVANNRIETSANGLVNSLSLARSEAVKRRARVSLCKSDDGADCETSGDYSQGWIVFADDGANVGSVDTGEIVLQRQAPLHETIALVGAGAGNIDNLISFNADGTTGDTGDLDLCDARSGDFGITVTLWGMGRHRMTTDVTCP